MARWTPDPSFYPSPRLAMEAPAEEVAYVALLNPDASDGRPDALGVLDLASGSATYGQLVGRVEMPNAGDELHHFGWNACSAALCPWAPHPHVERRYLVVPGLKSSRIHIVDTRGSAQPLDCEGDRARRGVAQDGLTRARTRRTADPRGFT